MTFWTSSRLLARLAARCRTATPGAFLGAAMLLSGTSVLIGATPATPVAQASSPDFGSPPTGQIPILYNDRHVYSKPDVLKQGRVLAAYAKGRNDLLTVALDVRTDGSDGFVRCLRPHGHDYQTRRDDRRDGR